MRTRRARRSCSGGASWTWGTWNTRSEAPATSPPRRTPRSSARRRGAGKSTLPAFPDVGGEFARDDEADAVVEVDGVVVGGGHGEARGFAARFLKTGKGLAQQGVSDA